MVKNQKFLKKSIFLKYLHFLIFLISLKRQSSHLLEGFLYIEVILGRGLKVRHDVLGGTVLFNLRLRHLPLTFLVAFVSNQNKGEIVRVLGIQLRQELRAPCVNGLESLGVGQIEAEDAALGISIEGCAD
jgi:hypothetical protein